MAETSRSAWFTVPVALAVGCASLSFLHASQTPAPAGDRIVVGQLVDGVTGRPVGNALVMISSGTTAVPTPAGRAGSPPASGGTQRVHADDAGRFMFHSLPAGSYAMAVSLSGYQLAEFGQTRASGSSTRLELLPSTQRVTNVTIKMWKMGAIAGTIRDETGEPIGGARLQLVSVTGPASRRTYTVRGFSTTDDRGVYRFGEIPAGDYAVQVPLLVNAIPVETAVAYLDAMADRTGNRVRDDITASGGTLTTAGYQVGDQLIQPGTTRAGVPSALTVDAKGRLFVYPQTYHPSVPTITAATIVTVPPGEQRSGIDLTVRPVPAFRVSGLVRGASGPVPNTTVKIIPAGADADVGTPSIGGEIAMAVTRRDGTFTAIGIPAGRYTVSVVRTAAAPSIDGPAPTDLRLWWARAPLTVTDADVAKVQLDLAPGVTIAGQVEFESSTATPPAAAVVQRMRVVMRPAQGLTGERMIAAPVNAEGAFVSSEARPASYIVTVQPPPPGYALKEMRVGGRDVTGEPITLTESGVRDVVVVLTDKAGELTGTVAKRAAGGDVAVYAVPADPRSPAQIRPSLLRRVLAGGDGAFRFTATIPGEYFVIAVLVDGTEIDAHDPRVAGALVRLGTRVTVGDREKKSVNLTVVALR